MLPAAFQMQSPVGVHTPGGGSQSLGQPNGLLPVAPSSIGPANGYLATNMGTEFRRRNRFGSQASIFNIEIPVTGKINPGHVSPDNLSPSHVGPGIIHTSFVYDGQIGKAGKSAEDKDRRISAEDIFPCVTIQEVEEQTGSESKVGHTDCSLNGNCHKEDTSPSHSVKKSQQDELKSQEAAGSPGRRLSQATLDETSTSLLQSILDELELFRFRLFEKRKEEKKITDWMLVGEILDRFSLIVFRGGRLLTDVSAKSGCQSND